MPKTIRFHLDEHAADAIARSLRHQGIDITTTADAGLLLIWEVMEPEEMRNHIEFL